MFFIAPHIPHKMTPYPDLCRWDNYFLWGKIAYAYKNLCRVHPDLLEEFDRRAEHIVLADPLDIKNYLPTDRGLVFQGTHHNGL